MVNEDSWHRFGTSGDQLEMGAGEVLEFSGAEGGIRSGRPQGFLGFQRVPQC